MDAILEVKKQLIQLDGDKKAEAETLIVNIPSGKPSNDIEVALRISDEKGVLLYKSSRLGDVQTTDTGYSVEVSEDVSLEGKSYELKNIATREVIASGKITAQVAQTVPAQVALPDTTDASEKSKNKKEKTV